MAHPNAMRLAFDVSGHSIARRAKVGAVIVVGEELIVWGFNHMPKYLDKCEPDHLRFSYPEVIHAERDSINAARVLGRNLQGGELYTTLSPCSDCAKLIREVGISSVYFAGRYRSDAGLVYLSQNGVRLYHHGT